MLRDRTGLVQLVFDEALTNAPLESCLSIEGTVVARPSEMINPKLLTGDIEIHVTKVNEINRAKLKLPFYIKPHNTAKESLRLQHRYLDLRHSWIQDNLKVRSDMTLKMRQFLQSEGFLDIETPTLFRRTPGGAQEFVVPTHLEDHFYSLVQSPQQFKQLLMVGGVEKYYQIARCYRDEGSRPDRQPEFTQVDIELSFTSAEKVRALVETMLKKVWPSNLPMDPFPQLEYKECISKFGSDKPDLRIGNEIQDLSPIAKTILFKNDQIKDLSRSAAKKMEKEYSDQHCRISFCYKDNGEIKTGVKKLLDEKTLKKIEQCDFDIAFIAIGADETKSQETLGKIRTLVIDSYMDLSPDLLKFLWVIDFPLFETSEDGSLESAHHPFTRPLDQDLHLLKSRPDLVRGQHYDLVLNGQEIGGGSMRIHESELQEYILQDILKVDTTELSHMLEALSFGCPPHGGIALGLDRLVAIICKAKSIRDVIAFPKTTEGKDLMSGSPATISSQDKLYYHLK